VIKIARVFPRKTQATPEDALSFVGAPPVSGVECDEVHISVTFTYDLPKVEELEKSWKHIAKVRIGGPATKDNRGEFTPGKYLKNGYVITSRGCPNHCAHCLVPRRFGQLEELKIKLGWIVQDDNVLACSYDHLVGVFLMLQKYKSLSELRGIEAKLLTVRHCELIAGLLPKQVFFACDTEDAIKPLRTAMELMRDCDSKFRCNISSRNRNRCYVLIGKDNETKENAERRLVDVYKAGFLPFAMLFTDENGNKDASLRSIQRCWSRPAIIRSMMKGIK